MFFLAVSHALRAVPLPAETHWATSPVSHSRSPGRPWRRGKHLPTWRVNLSLCFAATLGYTSRSSLFTVIGHLPRSLVFSRSPHYFVGVSMTEPRQSQWILCQESNHFSEPLLGKRQMVEFLDPQDASGAVSRHHPPSLFGVFLRGPAVFDQLSSYDLP